LFYLGYTFSQLEPFVGILMSTYRRESEEEAGKEEEEEASVSSSHPPFNRTIITMYCI
jgi:hypothetical protein